MTNTALQSPALTAARIIDGKASASILRARIKNAVEGLKEEHKLVPGLAVVLVGEDPASALYVRNKGEQTKEVGMNSFTHRLVETTSQADLTALIDALNEDPSVHGILVQLPLPGHIDSDVVLSRVSPEKDVDGFHVVNAGRLAIGQPALTPCTPLGCKLLLEQAIGSMRGLNALVIGRSNIVGRPMAQLLLQADCTVTIAHRYSRDLPELCRRADIIVAAVGRPEMIRGDWLKPGAVIIDVGINRVPSKNPEAAKLGKTRVVGDVAFDEAVTQASQITPVPGGVGPMTIACLLFNTVNAACRIAGVTPPAIGLS